MKYIVFDIDGVLADCSHRLKYIQGENKDYDKFYIEERNGNISLNSLDLDEYYGDITVVGNIHEDPELYEETKKRGW